MRYDARNHTLCDFPHAHPVPATRLHHLTGPTAQAANRLLDLAANIPLAGIERSCKLSQGVMSRDRLLMGQSSALLAGTSLEAAHRHLGLPASARSAYEQDRQRANFVYLGFDGSADKLSYRIYLEFPVNLAQQLDPSTAQMTPALLARGYKWDALETASERYDVTDYWWHPRLTVDQINLRLAALWTQQHKAPAALAAPALSATQTLVKKAIDLARQRANALDWQYLEVTEPASLRHSFDLNVYQANVLMKELGSELAALGEALRIPKTEVDAFLADVGEATLGHVSGGVGRDGLPFLTVYYADPDAA